MGEGNSKKARTYIKIASVFMLVVDFCVAFSVIIYKDSFSHLFTNNEAVLLLLKPVFDTMSILLVVGGSAIVLSGALRGLGLQTEAAWIILISQYGCSIPSGYVFAIVMGHGLRGIWQGIILGNCLQSLLYYYVLAYRLNWDLKAIEISTKMRSQKSQEEASSDR